jgi:hypothetical protein
MVNHLRTLLLNLPASPDSAREELVEASFSPKLLTAAQSSIRRAVFPGNYDREYQNFIATLLHRLCYDSPFASDLKSLDPRVLVSDLSSDTVSFEPDVTIERITSADSVRVRGSLLANEEQGEFSKTWQIRYSSASELFVQDITGRTSRTETLTFSNGSSASFLLEGKSTLTVNLENVSSVPVGLRATITATSPMSYDLKSLYERLNSTGSVRSILPLSSVEPVRQKCRHYFGQSVRFDLSIAAALTAYAYSFEGDGR